MLARLRKDYTDQQRKRDLEFEFSAKRNKFILSKAKSTFDEEGRGFCSSADISGILLDLNKAVALRYKHASIVSQLEDLIHVMNKRSEISNSEVEALQISTHFFEFATNALTYENRRNDPKLAEKIVYLMYSLIYCMLPDQITATLGLSVLVGDLVSCLNDISCQHVSLEYQRSLLMILGNIGIHNPGMVKLLESHGLAKLLWDVHHDIQSESVFEGVVFLAGVVITYSQEPINVPWNHLV